MSTSSHKLKFNKNGGEENYALAEKDETTALTVAFDVPPKLEEYFKVNYPKAFEQLKILAKRKQ